MSTDDASPDDASTDRDPLDLLVEEFLRRLRAGESVEVDSFAAANPQQREVLLELLPTLQALEKVKRDKESTGGLRARVALPAMQQLGDFRIVREVGRGGMGVVFEAVQESLSRRVALKVLPQASLLTGNQLMRFQREAQFAAGLHHSNIVPVFGSGETDGYHWYAMQFISGLGLDAWRVREAEQELHGSGAWRERTRFVAHAGEQVASALHYAHGQGTLHRDIKPANLLLDDGDHVWVTDFGLAKALEAEGLTNSGDMLGTLQYMAPEQFAGEYDVRSEVYAVGITLYELLTRQPAFSGRTRSELMDAIRTGRPTSLRRLCPEVAEDLVIVIEKAAASDPRDRYQDAEELQHDLQAFLEDRPIAARRQSSMALLLRWCRRNRAVAALTAAALLLAVITGITGWVAYVVTNDALGTAQAATEAERMESRRREATLQLSLQAIGYMFDATVGPDPLLLFDEDPDTGEQSVLTTRAVDAQGIVRLQQMLRFYDEFATQNADSQALRFETARAHRRIGVIHARLGQLDEAAAAYDQALARYSDVDDRDVTRELAAVYVEYSQLELLRMRPPDIGRWLSQSTRWLTRALELLENEPATGDVRALRFDRANVHLLLAQSRGMAYRAGGSRRDRMTDTRQHADAALALAAGLAAEESASAEARGLHARCLLASALWRRPDDPVAAEERQAGVQILRELAELDGGARYRLELCRELSGRRGRRRGADTAARLGQLTEAREHASQLLREFPEDAECQLMRAEVGRELAQWLSRPTAGQADEKRQAQAAAAEVELRVARDLQLELLVTRDVDLRLVGRAIEVSGTFDALLRQSSRGSEADSELDRFVRALRRGLERRGTEAKGSSRWPLARRGPPDGGERREGPRMRPGSRGGWWLRSGRRGMTEEFLGRLRTEGLLPEAGARPDRPERRDRRPDRPAPEAGRGR